MRYLTVLLLVCLAVPQADASSYRHKKAMETARAEQDQKQWQEQVAKSDAKSMSSAEGGHATGGDASSNASIEGDRTENNSTNVVMVPNNNTENCLRVWGIMFGNSSASGGIGYPHRSAACDFEQAADDAASVGDHNLAWYWRCHKRNLYKPFKGKGVAKEDAIDACFVKMADFMDLGTMAERNRELEERVKILLAERERDYKRCEESKDRIVAGCMK